MGGTMPREIHQLLRTVRYYIAQAKSVLSKHQQLESMTVGEITKAHRRGGLSPGEIVLAHYGSAAVRLATIFEIQEYKPMKNYRERFYERSGKRKTAWTSRKISGEITIAYKSISTYYCAIMSLMRSLALRTIGTLPPTDLRY
jgi:hypothetical protein